jgi:hypothetical protein
MFEDRAHQVIKSMDWLHSKCVLDVSEVHVKVDDYGWFATGKRHRKVCGDRGFAVSTLWGNDGDDVASAHAPTIQISFWEAAEMT